MITLPKRSTFLSKKDDGAKLRVILSKTDVMESGSRVWMYTRWKLYLLKNLTVLAALLKDVPMSCKDAVLHKTLLKNWAIICLTFEENTGQPFNDDLWFFVLVLSIRTEIRDWKKKLQNFSIYS